MQHVAFKVNDIVIVNAYIFSEGGRRVYDSGHRVNILFGQDNCVC